MDTVTPRLLWLSEVAAEQAPRVGGKAARLSELARAGFTVPQGFCLTVDAYELFLREGALEPFLNLELERKPLESMRWEELWDTALRIRSRFLATPIPGALASEVGAALSSLELADRACAVRSSAPGEDSQGRSFAGLHESVVGVVGLPAVLDAVRIVWASLWSDAALLYRKELSLSPLSSRMAVVVQRIVEGGPSGVAFGRDPRGGATGRQIVEAVAGACADLVDGRVDPDHWVLDGATGEVLEWRSGERGTGESTEPLLDPGDLSSLSAVLRKVEALLGWPPDVEWIDRGASLTLLQARPITTHDDGPEDSRRAYLELRPSALKLRELRRRVAEELIPALEQEGQRLVEVPVESLADGELARAIDERASSVLRWRGIYRDAFIPFAHGVRRLGTYYNDAVKPDDPYEFVGLLRGQTMLAGLRNRALEAIARELRSSPALLEAVRRAESSGAWARQGESLRAVPGGEVFLKAFDGMLQEHFDVRFGERRWNERPGEVLAVVLELAGRDGRVSPSEPAEATEDLERKLLDAVGATRSDEAEEVVATARVSWKLRDDDNVLLARVEGQLLRAIEEAERRLRGAGRLRGPRAREVDGAKLAEALREPDRQVTLVRDPEPGTPKDEPRGAESPRQLVGQPAAPGLATGRARRVVEPGDVAAFRAGEVLVCDAIQPTMTHVVPLACAVVERRGGMLIHGAIIARELGVPCVNGIAGATRLLRDGDVVTVDGHLGIVTVGEAEFTLEREPG